MSVFVALIAAMDCPICGARHADVEADVYLRSGTLLLHDAAAGVRPGERLGAPWECLEVQVLREPDGSTLRVLVDWVCRSADCVDRRGPYRWAIAALRVRRRDCTLVSLCAAPIEPASFEAVHAVVPRIFGDFAGPRADYWTGELRAPPYPALGELERVRRRLADGDLPSGWC